MTRTDAAALQRLRRDEPGSAWETTLDENARSLLQVRVSHGDAADDIFSKLMGDIVEPRREFIQDNALAVSNFSEAPRSSGGHDFRS